VNGRSEFFEIFLAGVTKPLEFTRDDFDGYHGVWTLSLLTGDERIAAEDILISKLADNDGRAAAALAEAGCVRAIPALTDSANASSSPSMRVFAAAALLKLGDYSGRAALVEVLRTHAGITSDRTVAVRRLAEFPDPDKEFLLKTVLTDPDSTVRSEAVTALLTAYGLGDEEVRWGEVLRGIGGRLLSSLPSVREEALTELHTILARWEAGETAEELGLTWHADDQTGPLRDFQESVGGDAEDFPVDGLRDLTDRERNLVENLILLRLDKDRRAVRAAGRLSVHRAIEPLRELLESADDSTKAEILSALHTLSRH
jgi:HEAT repeat protein